MPATFAQAGGIGGNVRACEHRPRRAVARSVHGWPPATVADRFRSAMQSGRGAGATRGLLSVLQTGSTSRVPDGYTSLGRRGHARAWQACREGSTCRRNMIASGLPCPPTPPGDLMVRRGSTVRVRQRALQEPRRCGVSFSIDLQVAQFAVGMEPFRSHHHFPRTRSFVLAFEETFQDAEACVDVSSQACGDEGSAKRKRPFACSSIREVRWAQSEPAGSTTYDASKGRPPEVARNPTSLWGPYRVYSFVPSILRPISVRTKL